MKMFQRRIILTVMTLSFVLSLYLIYQALQVKEWGAIAGSLAVITAVIAAFISLKIIWRQEDDLEPDIFLDFDLNSRSGNIQLVIKNIGGNKAYDVKVMWQKPVLNLANKEMNFPSIPVLQKGREYRLLVGPTVQTMEKAKREKSELNFYGKLL